MKCAHFAVALAALLGGCVRDQAPAGLVHHSSNVAADVRRMWETQPLGSNRPGELASTEQAVEAADRVFSTIQLVGLTREEVMARLGDPRHSSSSTYNFPFWPAPRGALVYRFDTGMGGWQFNILFDRKEKVRKVDRIGID